jgi:hypothetical protein
VPHARRRLQETQLHTSKRSALSPRDSPHSRPPECSLQPQAQAQHSLVETPRYARIPRSADGLNCPQPQRQSTDAQLPPNETLDEECRFLLDE